MKNLFLLFISIVLFTGISLAQEAKIAKPEALGHASTDGFVDDAFAIYDKVYETKAELAKSDSVVTALEKKADPTSAEIKTAQAAVLQSTTKLEGLQKDATDLLGKFDDVMTKSKSITPKTKMPKAAKNLNTAKQALMEAKNEIPAQLKVAADQKARLELIKAIN